MEARGGLAVVTQTCDIVNAVLGKDYVVVSPLRELTEQAIEDVQGLPVITTASAVRESLRAIAATMRGMGFDIGHVTVGQVVKKAAA